MQKYIFQSKQNVTEKFLLPFLQKITIFAVSNLNLYNFIINP